MTSRVTKSTLLHVDGGLTRFYPDSFCHPYPLDGQPQTNMLLYKYPYFRHQYICLLYKFYYYYYSCSAYGCVFNNDYV